MMKLRLLLPGRLAGLACGALAAAWAGPVAYVSLTDANQVARVDLDAQAVTAYINVGSDPRGIDASPDGSRVYVANRFGNSVSVIDTTSQRVVRTYDLAAAGVITDEPYDVAVSPDGTFLAVAMKNGGSESGDGAVVLVDVASGAVTEVALDSAASPEGVVITPDGARVFASGRGSLYAVDVASRNFLGAVGRADRELVVTPDGQWVLAENNAVNTSTLDAVTWPGYLAGRGMAVTPDGARLFGTDGGLVAYDLSRSSTNTPVWTMAGEIVNTAYPAQYGAYGVDLTDDGKWGLVSWRNSSTVQIFDTQTLTFISPPIPTTDVSDGGEPKQLVILEDSGAGPSPGPCPLTAVALSGPQLDPQTGLFEQRVSVATSGCAAAAVELRVSGLAAGTTVYNATGDDGGTPVLRHDHPVAAGSSVTFVVEYFRSDRALPGPATFSAVAVDPAPVAEVPGPRFEVLRTVFLESGAMLVEFESRPGRAYAVEYSADMQTWQTAGPPVTAAGNRVQWLDQGPPLTDSAPAANKQRYYRVVELPAP